LPSKYAGNRAFSDFFKKVKAVEINHSILNFVFLPLMVKVLTEKYQHHSSAFSLPSDCKVS